MHKDSNLALHAILDKIEEDEREKHKNTIRRMVEEDRLASRSLFRKLWDRLRYLLSKIRLP